MAVEKDLNDKDDNTSDESSGASATPLSNGGSGAAGGPAGSAPSAAGATPSNRPNIQQYIDANQGAGDQLAQGIQQRYGQDTDSFKHGLDDTSANLDQASQPLKDNLGDKAETQIQSSFKDPSKILASQDSLSQYQKLRDQGYQGDIKNLGNQLQTSENGLQNQLDSLGNNANLANSENGRFQLLNQAYASPTYTKGQQRLDQLFLQNSPGTANTLQQGLQAQKDSAVQKYNDVDTANQAKLAALTQLSGDRSNEIKNGLASNMGDIATNVQKEYNDLQNKYNPADDQSLQAAVKSNNLTPQQLAELGVKQGINTWGLSGQDLLNAGHYSYNPILDAAQGGNAQAATPEEMARYNALLQLSGNSQPSMFGSATQAGYKPVSFDSNAMQQAIDQRKQLLSTTDFVNAIGGRAATMVPGLADGSITPQQANDILKQRQAQEYAAYNDAHKNGGATVDWNAVNAEWAPWNNYVNNVYNPAASSLLGVNQSSSSDTLDTTPIDWGAIRAPLGK
jgi:hypothetical protein